jgi:hypothetical protein
MAGIVRLEFFGRQADQNELDVYDAGKSIEGLARTLSILGHYYQTGQIISQAPSSQARISIRPPRAGSFLLEVAAAALGGFIATVAAVPIGTYLNVVMSKWLPGGSEADRARIENLRRRLEIAEAHINGLEAAEAAREGLSAARGDIARLELMMREYKTDFDVMRSITAKSFGDIFRPVGRSADFAAVYGDDPGAYAGVMDAASVAQLEVDIPDPDVRTIEAVVNSFSRSSKSGIAFSSELGRGFRFHYGQMGKLSAQDDFSWSQYHQRNILMSGRFYYFFDGSIKRLEVLQVERTGDGAP